MTPAAQAGKLNRLSIVSGSSSDASRSTHLSHFWKTFCLFIVFGLYGILSTAATAQEEVEAESRVYKTSTFASQQTGNLADHSNSSQHDTSPTSKHESRGAFVVAPLPIASPALGAGIVPVFAYIFQQSRNDRSSPASVLAMTGLVTNNGSRAIALGAELYFKESTYRITAIFVQGNLNYDLYGMGAGTSQARLRLNQTGQVFLGEVARRIGWNFLLGPRFSRGNSLITLRPADVGSNTLPPDIGTRATLTALGLHLDRDTRPNRFYPTTGTLLDFTSDFFSQSLGSKYSFQSYKLTFNKYGSLGPTQILAYNFFGCATGGQPPFYGNCIYGTNSELRGYVAGRYLDRYILASQLEYRLSLPKRLGLVAFGGLGEVVPGGNQPFRATNFLLSVGGGVRFQLSKKYHVNLRVDFAQGVTSHTWSVGVGEAF